MLHVHDIFDNRPVTMLFQIRTFVYDLRLSICLLSWNRHLYIKILHFEH